ncbi:MAG: hypothetical protein AB7N54_03830 [Alphaproteobacteria bacterium]
MIERITALPRRPASGPGCPAHEAREPVQAARANADTDGRNPAARLDGFARGLAQQSWFAAAGEALTDGEVADAAAWLAGLGLATLDGAAVGIATVAGWREAAAVAADPAWDRRWWDAEEAARTALRAPAVAAAGGESALLDLLTGVTDAAGTIVHGAAAVAAARSGVADAALLRVAAGAAAQACYQTALLLAAGGTLAGDHAFAAKYRLFAAGRWPLGIVAGRYYLF